MTTARRPVNRTLSPDEARPCCADSGLSLFSAGSVVPSPVEPMAAAQGMTRLESATRRLEESVARLEGVIEERVTAQATMVTEEEYDSLKQATAAVSDRLDQVIVRLRQVLEA